MKKALLSAFLIISVASFGQDTISNFRIESGKVLWEYAYSPDIPTNKFLSTMKLSGHFSDIDTVNGQVIARFKNYEANYKGAGYKHSQVGLYISHGCVNAFVNVKITGNNIHIEIKNISFSLREDLPLTGKKDDVIPLEELSINKKGVFKTGKLWEWPSTAKILDYSFRELFSELLTNVKSL